MLWNSTLTRVWLVVIATILSKTFHDSFLNSWRREALKRVFTGTPICKCVTHSVVALFVISRAERDRLSLTLRARRHIEIETAHQYNWRDHTKTKNFCGYSVQQIPGVAKHLSVQVTQLATCNLNPLRPKGSPFDESGVRQSKIYKTLLGLKGLNKNSLRVNPIKQNICIVNKNRMRHFDYYQKSMSMTT